ncbi:hypothetical protein [Streptomyces sp. NBC_00859]|uniref:hypothetical protein n=1 Tax=Streptomyces sp. NBC_00859 TaxID=2903682 RepID=UPI003865B07C|nr:hypothetical protein OG584_18260 [Streptomyces sp. NBC_00859]
MENRAAAARRMDGLSRKNQELQKKLTAEERHSALQKQLTAVQKRHAATDRRVPGMEKSTMVRMGAALRRRVRAVRQSGGCFAAGVNGRKHPRACRRVAITTARGGAAR